MTVADLVEKARKAKETFGTKCPKFAGAATVEIIRAALARRGILTSSRDVFIRGVPVEIDLIIPCPGAKPFLGLVYEPAQVVLALELKNSGSFGEPTLQKIKRDFGRLRQAGVECAYLTFEERRGYKWAVSGERLGSPCFTLAWHRKTNGPVEPTRDWERFVVYVEDALRGRAVPPNNRMQLTKPAPARNRGLRS